ncbi:MAG: hypothetical protein P8M30_18425 [Planctomycetaceae bacterium]|nr:hypothetical protein [bacterium]MDB4679359.1 hypothetical protein [Planctomycetaceae bacterium]MDC0307861.1 hypothetical protein [Planctomycetaceae bacterium]MDG2391288.1 hypothetical protein [Planctomycetaceae bacterium]
MIPNLTTFIFPFSSIQGTLPINTSPPLRLLACLAILIANMLLGCGDSRSTETTNADDIPKSEVIVPEKGGEPVLAEEGP